MRRQLIAILAALVLATGCSTVIDGVAEMPATETPYLDGLDVDDLLLDAEELRDITGSGLDLTQIPGMDSKQQVDDEPLVTTAPPECQYVYRETLVFGPDVKQFHKTSFQTPTDSAILSEGAAAYADGDAARAAFDNLANLVAACATNPTYAASYIGDWTLEADSIRTRNARSCGRVYVLRANVLIEVTYCGYSEVVPNLVADRIASRVP